MSISDILIVSDAPNLRASLAGILQYAGFHVDTVHTAGALDLLRRKPADLLFLDLRIPYDSGLKLLFTIRAMYAESIVVLASTASPELHDKAVMNGAGAFLTKPVEPAEIIRTARQAAVQRPYQNESSVWPARAHSPNSPHSPHI